MEDERSSTPVLLVAAAAVMIVAAAYYLGVRSKGKEAVESAKPALIALYLDAPVKGTGDPAGLRVAEVSVDGQGVATLTRSNEKATADALQDAIAEAAVLRSLPLFLEGKEAGPQGSEQTLSAQDLEPGHPRYPWALAGFLRARTGLRYKIIY